MKVPPVWMLWGETKEKSGWYYFKPTFDNIFYVNMYLSSYQSECGCNTRNPTDSVSGMNLSKSSQVFRSWQIKIYKIPHAKKTISQSCKRYLRSFWKHDLSGDKNNKAQQISIFNTRSLEISHKTKETSKKLENVKTSCKCKKETALVNADFFFFLHVINISIVTFLLNIVIFSDKQIEPFGK